MTNPGLFALESPRPHHVPPPPIHASKEPIPDWMLRRLQAAGHIDATTGATRRTRACYCQNCHRGVMRGLTSPPTSWPADVDPIPLTPLGEVMALMAGTRTYELRWIGDHQRRSVPGLPSWGTCDGHAATLRCLLRRT